MDRPSIIHYAATYSPIPSGYLGQLVDWPEVVTEGTSLADCRVSLADALHEMILAYKQLKRPIPEPLHVAEQLAVEA